ncbi:hypothetical protein MTR_4g008990 [Medicago truncatula]|uniref:Uncharacterized protein n=1 Tax=Medicago truncatula TaxID=3880 RepID=G7JFM5_MEDTR|nr:hypothetical protein MTR_4g008990 [Medicago truncatula]
MDHDFKCFIHPKEISLSHEFILIRDLLAQLYPSFIKEDQTNPLTHIIHGRKLSYLNPKD